MYIEAADDHFTETGLYELVRFLMVQIFCICACIYNEE